MKKISKISLAHVEKMSDSEMKQILGGNTSSARLTGDNCYEAYDSSTNSTFCTGYCAPYAHYDSSTGNLTMIPRICRRTNFGCHCVMSGIH